MRRLGAALIVALLVAGCSGDDTAPDDTAPDVVSATATDDGTSDTTGTVGDATDFETTAPADTGDDTAETTDAPAAGGTSSSAPTCWEQEPLQGPSDVAWADVTGEAGLDDLLDGIAGHAAAWGDVDGDNDLDLFVGTFATRGGADYGGDGPAPDRLLLGDGHAFTMVESFPEMRGRTSGAALVDLDGDDDLDLVLSRNASRRDPGGAATTVLANDGAGTFTTVDDAGFDPSLGGRSIGVLDIDEDGLLDLLVVVDQYQGGSSRIYRNLGDLRFEDATAELGFPEDVAGLGIATSDLNGDARTDVFVAGSNRLFIGTGSGLTEVAAPELAWESYGVEDDVAGAAIADVNRDGRLDLLVGHHYNSTLSQGTQVPVRLYLNRTDDIGAEPVFEEVTEAAGLTGIPTKAPHVELADLDNDGWLDVVTSASADDGRVPAIFRGTGLDGDIPTFEEPQGMGAPQYWVTAPTADYNRDGRLDVLLVEWEPPLPNLLFANGTGTGHWLEVSVDASLGGGPGTRVEVYEEGGAGDLTRLLGAREIVATLGYTAGVTQTAHFGLGDVTLVDVVVMPPLDAAPITLTGTPVDRHIRLPDGCG